MHPLNHPKQILSIVLLIAAQSQSTHAADMNISSTLNTPQPSAPEACIGLASSSERLSCYDNIFKPLPSIIDSPNLDLFTPFDTTAATSPTDQMDQDHDDAADKKTRLEQWRDNAQAFMFFGAAPEFDPTSSLLDQRWELSDKSKLGTWQIRSYQPVYLLPAIWTSKKNSLPSSPNPDNTVTEPQLLDSVESKFQISLKTKAIEGVFANGEGDLWLGYTQSSRWQVYNSEDSRPFRETNYEPEASLVFRTNYNLLGLNGRLLGFTLNHQSNGRSDPLSRSWNRVMLNLGFERDNFALMLRPWYRVEEDAKDDNNPDIKNYIGRGDLTANYKWNDHNFALMLRHSLKGGENSHGAVQFDWAFPLKGSLRGHLQLFDGYGESLIDYNHRATYVGLGVSLMNWF